MLHNFFIHIFLVAPHAHLVAGWDEVSMHLSFWIASCHPSCVTFPSSAWTRPTTSPHPTRAKRRFLAPGWVQW